MKPLSGPSEAHRTKNGTFKQSYRPIVVAGQQSAASPQFIPQDSLHSIQRVWSECMKLWHQQELQEPFPQTIQGLFRSLHWRKHCWTSLKIVSLALKHLELEVTGSRASHSDTGLKQGTKTKQKHFFRGISLLLNFIAVYRVEVKQYVNQRNKLMISSLLINLAMVFLINW